MLRPIIRWSLAVSLCGGVLSGALTGFAQTSSPPPPSLQIQPAPAPQVGPAANVSGVSSSATPAGPVATPVPGVGTIPSSSLGKSFGSAGRGLPGMPGGPPVSGTPGGQDPSSTWMRPLQIPPLLCDPATDIPC
ncbi:MAG TPA: hypothetical protein VLD60_06575 [Nitrospira sp.]|nr:hypothetical protein [Nitrospira sp.]